MYKIVQEEAHVFRRVPLDDPRPAYSKPQPTPRPTPRPQARQQKDLSRFAPLPCIHLGAPTGERRECKGCHQTTSAPIRSCAIHGQCTETALASGIACCRICPDRNTTPPAVATASQKAILITGGLGDAIALDTLMTPEERAELDTIYYACPAWPEISALFKAVPQAYPKLRHHVSLKPLKTYYSKSQVEADHGAIPADDWSIASIFPSGRKYTGCSFLQYPLTTPRTIGQPYVVITPYSTWGKWKDRNFDDRDWNAVYDFLAAKNLLGVVLVKGGDKIPSHPRVINLSNQTTILESVELLKAAVGYLGIDTWISVPASKLFSSNLAVKSRNKHCAEWKHVYFAPKTTFNFMQRKLTPPR